MAETRGFKVYTHIDRPPQELVEPFREFATCNVCDALGRFGSMDYRIKPMVPGWKMAGTAITLRTRPCDNLLVYKALEIAQPGDVLVIAIYEYDTNSTWGDLTSMIAQAKGMAGVVTDGVVRDISGLRAVGFPVFARGLNPNSPMKDGPGEVNVPVVCGGVLVNPGDIVVGDDDGVVVVPKDEAAAIIEGARAIVQKEEKIVADIKSGKLIPDWVNKALAEKGCQIV
ncbi:MAG: 4-carboxy-4-hydroxy-2-oxoadipate aldolase/oxaloacetate decarboxylase [Chloroflexota bacterium]